MPLARISIPAHISSAKAQALANAVHEALVATCNVPEKDRFQLVTRFSTDAMIIDPTFPDLRRTADASIVEILFLSGRSDEQKRSLYSHVVEATTKAGFPADDIMIALSENSPIDWSPGRGLAYREKSSL